MSLAIVYRIFVHRIFVHRLVVKRLYRSRTTAWRVVVRLSLQEKTLPA